MDSLRLLLVKNQNNLDRLWLRANYCHTMWKRVEYDFHKQYGPYAEAWDEWHDQITELSELVGEDLDVTRQFIEELRNFIMIAQTRKRRTASFKLSCQKMQALAQVSLNCQQEMLAAIDTRIINNREFTKHLLLVESVDGMSEDY